MTGFFSRIGQSLRWRLGMPVAAAALEAGTDESISDFYNSRVTGCEFLEDPEHYEHPRARWVLENVSGGSLLEIGCGNGGMTRLLAPKVGSITAFDVSAPSLAELEKLGLQNVKTVQGLIEQFRPSTTFDWVLLSEVIEHLRDPKSVVDQAFEYVSPGGNLLITTPNGHWESDEHLHEFSLQTFCELLSRTACESLTTGYLRDRDGRRRWLTAILKKAETDPVPDDFFDRSATRKLRRKSL
ncbi:MAG TPA: class I SAM-dependent methyltransferase [Pyrinomonadaceae bacterium]|mgnify:CR=1 FL=1|nr:class I SAM-dependent methyltransferase [Pyrinomonadaceae bacterium]